MNNTAISKPAAVMKPALDEAIQMYSQQIAALLGMKLRPTDGVHLGSREFILDPEELPIQGSYWGLRLTVGTDTFLSYPRTESHLSAKFLVGVWHAQPGRTVEHEWIQGELLVRDGGYLKHSGISAQPQFRLRHYGENLYSVHTDDMLKFRDAARITAVDEIQRRIDAAERRAQYQAHFEQLGAALNPSYARVASFERGGVKGTLSLDNPMITLQVECKDVAEVDAIAAFRADRRAKLSQAGPVDEVGARRSGLSRQRFGH